MERMVASIYDAQGDLNDAITNNDLLLGTRQVFTPFNYAVVVIGNKVQVLQQKSLSEEPDNDVLDDTVLVPDSNLLWPSVIGLYGTLRPGVSQLRLEQNDESEVIGTISLDPNDDRLLLFDVDSDTVPQNTLEPITAVVDPQISGPANGLPAAVAGQRYLLTSDMGSIDNQQPAAAWQGANGRPLIASANDIVEYNGDFWRTVFLSSTIDFEQYVTNLTTGIQYRWDGESWAKSYQGVYRGGTWRLVL